MRVSMINGRVAMSNNRVIMSNRDIVNTPTLTEEMVGQGKKQITNLMLKLETPKKYISFK